MARAPRQTHRAQAGKSPGTLEEISTIDHVCLPVRTSNAKMAFCPTAVSVNKGTGYLFFTL
jgi:hypothetical protein